MSIRVLVVDDNRELLLSFQMLLEYMGHEVRTAPDGWTAVAIARHWRPEVILLDIGMPGIVGFEVARLIRETEGSARSRIIAVTGYDRDASKAHISPFDGWLTKPVTEEALIPFLN